MVIANLNFYFEILCFHWKIGIYYYVKLDISFLFGFPLSKDTAEANFALSGKTIRCIQKYIASVRDLKRGIAAALHKKWSFPLRISLGDVTKSPGNCGFSHIYWRNP